MKIRKWKYEEGRFTMELMDKNKKPLGLFIVTDFELIKSLRHSNLNKVEIDFKELM